MPGGLQQQRVLVPAAVVGDNLDVEPGQRGGCRCSCAAACGAGASMPPLMDLRGG